MSLLSRFFRTAVGRGWFLTLVAWLVALPATGHPLGDFSINQYFVLDGNAATPSFYYLLDVAEIPSFTELDLLDTDYDSEVSKEEVEIYLNQRIPELAAHLECHINREQVPLSVVRHKLILLEGNAGMVVFNVLLGLEASGTSWPASGPVTVTLTSQNYPREQGTRECLVLGGVAFFDSSGALPPEIRGAQEPVAQDVIAAPVYTNRAATFTLQLSRDGASAGIQVPLEEAIEFAWTSTARLAAVEGETGLGGGIAGALVDSGFRTGMPGAPPPLVNLDGDVPKEAATQAPRQQADSFASRLMDQMSAIVRGRELPPLLFALGLVIAAGLGMGHALAPGHGKTVMAAYLIGEQGTAWHAVVLGIVVTLTHTWSVLLLGVVTLNFEGWLSEEQVNFWTGVLSGAIIVLIGLVLFRRRYHFLLASESGSADSWRFYHGHDHVTETPRLVEGVENKPPGYGSIFWLGVSGGVVPCPAALIVLLLALKVGRLAYGLALILAFSVGLALVLVIVGLLVVRASRLLHQRKLATHPAVRLLPLASAGLITLLGGWVIVWTLLQFDVLRFG